MFLRKGIENIGNVFQYQNDVRDFMKSNLILGGIYKTEWSDKPCRIIGLDNVEVFYDCLWQHDNAWAFSGNFKKRCYFYRAAKDSFEKKSQLLNNLPLTQEEHVFFRPDLPMRFARTMELNWNEFRVSGFKEFLNIINGLKNKRFLDERIDTNEVVLIPYGPNNGLKKGTIIKANNGKNFECSEVIWKAKELQESVNGKTSNGIGIFRIGFEKDSLHFTLANTKI